MIVSERGLRPASLSPKRRSEPRIISVWALPTSSRSISGISIGARPSASMMLMMSSTCSSTVADTAPAVQRQIEQAREQAAPDQPAADAGRGFVVAHASPPSTARRPGSPASASGRPAAKSHSAWR